MGRAWRPCFCKMEVGVFLVDTIFCLKNKIEVIMKEQIITFVNELKSNHKIFSYDEAATKQAVVLRLLNFLGWNTFNANHSADLCFWLLYEYSCDISSSPSADRIILARTSTKKAKSSFVFFLLSSPFFNTLISRIESMPFTPKDR